MSRIINYFARQKLRFPDVLLIKHELSYTCFAEDRIFVNFVLMFAGLMLTV